MPQETYLNELNPSQRRAVEHGVIGDGPNIAGPVLAIAGAGSGKTSVLAHRVAHLVVNGVSPNRILLLTFTRLAANEMKQRAGRILAKAQSATGVAGHVDIPWSGTFHAIGARLLRQYANRVGLDPNFTIHDRANSEDLMDLVRHRLGYADLPELFPKKATCLAIHSRMVNSGAGLRDVLEKHFPWCVEWRRELRKLYRGYVEAKQQQHVLDYDDLLLYWAELLGDAKLARQIGDKFDHVLVDEYQDTNALQAKILQRLKPDGRGVMVVGDDAQAIYGFRAAEVRNILDFPKQFSPAATVVKLEQNYRSTQLILKASNAVMRFATERFTKDLFSDRNSGDKPSLVTVEDDLEQATFVAQRVLHNREAGQTLRQQAVLIRAGRDSAMLEAELARRKIPFVKFGGMQFTEAAHIRDMLATLRWAENPADQVSGFRVLQLLPGFGNVTAAKVLDLVSTGKQLDQFEPPAKSATLWVGLVKLLRQLHRDKAGWPTEIELVRAWYQPLLEYHYKDVIERAADLDQLQAIAGTFKSRSKFLTDLTLDPQDTSSKQGKAKKGDDDYLTISTIHSAKGQEWASVFVLNAVEGCIPSSRSETDEDFEEERRLLYVAMTRAKDNLVLMVPWRLFTHGRDVGGGSKRTRFIPDKILKHFEMLTASDQDDDDPAMGGRSPRAFDLPRRIRDLE